MADFTRRRALAGGGVLAAALLTTRSTDVVAAQPPPPVADRIAALQRAHNAQIGVYAADLASGRSIAHNDDQLFAMCSTFKAYAAARVLQKADRGELRLTDAVTIDAADLKPNSPVTETRVGQNMTLAELCAAALQVSDNAAGNWLLRVIGFPSRITEFARTIGDDRTRLDRWEIELNSATPGDPRDTTTPRAIGAGYRALLTGDVLSPASRQQLEDWMRANQTSSMRAGLPPGWTTADKTGSGDYGSTNDVGIAYGPQGQRLLLAFLTRSQGDDPKAPNMRPLIGELAALVVPALLQPQ
jgi:beta-lactamase class A